MMKKAYSPNIWISELTHFNSDKITKIDEDNAMDIEYTLIKNYQVHDFDQRDTNNSSKLLNLQDSIKGVSLAFGVKLLNSQFEFPLAVDTLSCINRSIVGGFFGLGAFSYMADCKVGRFCSFASRCSIGAFSHPTNWLSIHEFQYRDMTSFFGTTIHRGESSVCEEMRARKTFLGNDVWSGDNSVVLKGVHIGDGAIVAAGAIVTKDVDPYTIVGGNPAKPIKKRFNEQQIYDLLALRWWELSLEELRNVDFQNVDKAIDGLKKIVEH